MSVREKEASIKVQGLMNNYLPFVFLGWWNVVAAVVLIIIAYCKTDGHTVLSRFAYGGNIATTTLTVFFTLISGTIYRYRNGEQFKSAPWQWWLPIIASLVISAWSFVLYASYGDKIERLGNTTEGHDAETSLAWGVFGVSVVGALNAMSIKSEVLNNQGGVVSKGLIYLALPCISIALVSLGLMTAEVKYLITDG